MRTRSWWREREMAEATRMVVIGVGNEFRHDDGVGWTVIARLAELGTACPLPPGAALATCDGDPGRSSGCGRTPNSPW